MSFLKRGHAPIADEAWTEIDEAATRVLTMELTARKFVDVDGPYGWDYSSVGLGRLELSGGELVEGVEGVESGVRQSLPLIESRARCELDLWELDNTARGAKDPLLGPLEQAARRAARFEDTALFHGFEEAGVPGLLNSSPYDPIEVSLEADSFLEGLSQALLVLRHGSIEGPYVLVVGSEVFRFLASSPAGYPLIRRVSSLVGASVLESELVDGALLTSTRGGDFELVLGQDLSIGYESHDARHLRLYVTESFTFRVLQPESIARMVVAG